MSHFSSSLDQALVAFACWTDDNCVLLMTSYMPANLRLGMVLFLLCCCHKMLTYRTDYLGLETRGMSPSWLRKHGSKQQAWWQLGEIGRSYLQLRTGTRESKLEVERGPQRCSSSTKARPPNSPQAVPKAGDQVSKCWAYGSILIQRTPGSFTEGKKCSKECKNDTSLLWTLYVRNSGKFHRMYVFLWLFAERLLICNCSQAGWRQALVAQCPLC